MKKSFIEKTFRFESQEKIVLCNAILDEYKQQGFRLSLRQLYYQLVSRGYIENSQRSYKNIGSLVSDARQAGLIDWGMIEDRGRETVSVSHWDNPGEIIMSAAHSFRIDKWERQPYYVHAMVEKDALSGVLGPVCRLLDIPLTANKGYSSSSTMFEIGQILRHKRFVDGKNILILYLGDHDPSGIDMTRDVEERLEMYAENAYIEVHRLALNWDQIEQWTPPENPAKDSDSRFRAYADKFGESSWELDAVEPVELANLVRDEVGEVLDQDLWNEDVAQETEWRKELEEYANRYGDE